MIGRPRDPAALISSKVGFQPEVSSVNSGWNNVVLYQWSGFMNECELQVRHEPALMLHLAGEPITVRVAGERKCDRTYPGTLTFVPSNTSYSCSPGRNTASLLAYFNPDCLDALVASDISNAQNGELYFDCGFKDELLSVVLRSLAEEMRYPSQAGALYADSLADTLVMHLLRRFTVQKNVRKSSMFSPRLMRIALDVIEASIECGVSLKELADASGVSRSFFVKAFKESTGMAPHTYLTKQRINRASFLLANTKKPIVEIASLCGFSSQAHFTKAFRCDIGLTPLAYRNAKN